jgi:hypothetical protein
MSRPSNEPDRDANDSILPLAADVEGDSALGRSPQKRRLAVIALVLAVALLLAATSLFWLIVSPGSRAANAAGSRIGDCLASDRDGSTYRAVECRDAGAEFQVLALSADREGCVDVPGATSAVTGPGGFLCVGSKGADPATAINGLIAGDCVTVLSGRPERAACEEATLPVLAVVRDVDKGLGVSNDGLANVCRQAGAAEVRQTYAWGLGRADGSESGSWDRLLCLGSAGD